MSGYSLRRGDNSFAFQANSVHGLRKPIRALAADPRPPGRKKLASTSDYYRIRVGDYRVLYAVRDREVLVLVIKVGYRREVYR